MKVYIKQFDVDMQIKNKGVEFAVYDTSDNHIGDLYLTKTNLIWCEGKVSRQNGKHVSWKKFAELVKKA